LIIKSAIADSFWGLKTPHVIAFIQPIYAVIIANHPEPL